MLFTTKYGVLVAAMLLVVVPEQLMHVHAEPKKCPTEPNVVGFTSIHDLNHWMATLWYFINSGGFYPAPYFFTLCPNMVFEDDFIFPVLNDTWIICGAVGKSSDNCIIRGNETQIIIVPHEYKDETSNAPSLEHVHFLGLTMKESTDVSVGAYGAPNAWAFFHDCHWEGHVGRFAFHMLPPDNLSDSKTGPQTRTSMVVQLDGCTFKNNNQKHSNIVNNGGILSANNITFRHNENKWANILNFEDEYTSVRESLMEENDNYFTFISIGGTLRLYDDYFRANENKETVIHIIDGGSMVVELSSFMDNNNAVGPGIIDFESSLILNEKNSGFSNSGFGCEGFLLLAKDSVCEIEGECPATCCQFHDNTCDLSTSRPTIFSTNPPTRTPTMKPSTNPAQATLNQMQGKSSSSSGAFRGSREVVLMTLCLGLMSTLFLTFS